MATQVKFGLYGPLFTPVDKALEAITRIEAIGWDYVNFGDVLVGTHPMGMLPVPVPKKDPSLPTGGLPDMSLGSMEMCSVTSVLTKNLGIVLAVIDTLRRSPAVMAQEMVTLTHLSKGRISFAIGSGEAKQFDAFGDKRDKPIARMEEAIHIWHALWSAGGKLVSRESEFWPLKDAYFPIPLYEGKLPSLLITGSGEKIFQLAGTIGDGWMTYLPGGGHDLAKNISYVKKIAEGNGRDSARLRFNAMVILVLAETDEIAWRYARSPICGWLTIVASSIDSSKTWEKHGFQHPFGDFNWSKHMSATLVAKEDVGALMQRVPEELSDASLVWGGPERVARKLQSYIDAGMNEFCILNLSAGVDPETTLKFHGLMSDVMVRLGRKPLNINA